MRVCAERTHTRQARRESSGPVPPSRPYNLDNATISSRWLRSMVGSPGSVGSVGEKGRILLDTMCSAWSTCCIRTSGHEGRDLGWCLIDIAFRLERHVGVKISHEELLQLLGKHDPPDVRVGELFISSGGRLTCLEFLIASRTPRFCGPSIGVNSQTVSVLTRKTSRRTSGLFASLAAVRRRRQVKGHCGKRSRVYVDSRSARERAFAERKPTYMSTCRGYDAANSSSPCHFDARHSRAKGP